MDGSTVDISQVQSLEFGHLGLQGSYTPRRYSPYSYPPHHRMNYISVASRCAPQNQLQYQPLPSSVDYGAYNNPATSVDWRPPYSGQAGSYSPYPDDEESSPYTAQPPSYMLPNTDPMSANSSYYNYGHGARSHPSAHWSEPQSFISQPASQLTGVSYALPHEPPHPVHSFGSVGNLPSNRTLPEPITARSYFPAPASSNDVPMATLGRRSHYWHDNTGSSVHQLPTPIEATLSQEYSRGRGGLPYRVQDMNYSQTSLSQGLPSAPSGAYPTSNERPHSATAVPTEDVPSQQSLLSLMNPEAQKGNAETSGLSYDYAPSGTCNTSQLRSASGQLRPGPLYCQTTMLPQMKLARTTAVRTAQAVKQSQHEARLHLLPALHQGVEIQGSWSAGRDQVSRTAPKRWRYSVPALISVTSLRPLMNNLALIFDTATSPSNQGAQNCTSMGDVVCIFGTIAKGGSNVVRLVFVTICTLVREKKGAGEGELGLEDNVEGVVGRSIEGKVTTLAGGPSHEYLSVCGLWFVVYYGIHGRKDVLLCDQVGGLRVQGREDTMYHKLRA